MKNKHSWIYDLLFILVLLLAGYLRLTGVQWGEGQHQHPDELFLTGVLDNLRAQTCTDATMHIDICPEGEKRWLTLAEYFNTQTSPLNPYNRGYSFFVYGNLPMTLARVGVEISGSDHLGSSKFFARQISALADLLTIFVLYLLVSRMYDRRAALLASLFSALAVMQIQQSHFFTTDLFVNLFMFAAIYFAVLIIKHESPTSNLQSSITNYITILLHPLFLYSLAFGLFLGMAMASKINAAVLALLLPAAFALRHWLLHTGKPDTDSPNTENWRTGNWSLNTDYWLLIALFLIAGGLVTLLSFRVFQPYAFDGLGLNEQWVNNIAEQRAQANGDADLPWNLQWARRNHLYSFTNLTVWGLGLPLGMLAWLGFLLMGWRILQGERKHLLLWAWTAFYFGWQSLQFNPTMRYQLPVYPLLAMMAAWAVFEFRIHAKRSEFRISRITNYALKITGLAVVVLTTIWAFAFHSIYLRDETRIAASRWIYANVPGPINLQIQTEDETYQQPLSFPSGLFIQPEAPYIMQMFPRQSGTLTGITFGKAINAAGFDTEITVSITSNDTQMILSRASAAVNQNWEQVKLDLETPIRVSAGAGYSLTIETSSGAVSLSGAGIANETDYDWALPFRVDGYDPFGGMYPGDLNLQVYWDDNPDKLARYMDILSRTDYIFIPTNHQYAQITRLPERYPLTTEYYRLLLGCPLGEDIIRCYRVAKPGMYKGSLGFDLVQVFESYPTLGSLVINDQAAEEAFTFYDHPKVLIFKKSENFDAAKVQEQLGKVDLTKVIRLTPKQADKYEPQKNLLLPASRLAQLRAGGTWSQLFDYDWLQNKYPIIGMLVWYAFIFLLGVITYPITRLALAGLGAYAYPLSRTVGIVLLAWMSWMGGSTGIPYTRTSITGALILLAALAAGLAWSRRAELREEWNSNRRFILITEILFFTFFLIDLLIRLGNSDMWHPAKGGERPMDFSYFNAILKSESFPPYDPWYASGYINYYYYGFVLAGTPVKLLGIVPSIAYNFILPTWFALIAVNAFALGYALVNKDKDSSFELQPSSLLSGIAASLFTVLLGNLGTIKLIFLGLQRIGAPDGVVPVDTGILQKWGWALQGLFFSIAGEGLPIGRGEWYWMPSRVIPAPGDVEPITEFPLFTFLYSDLHAHMLVMPITLFIIAWAISFIKSRAQLGRSQWIAAFGIAALMIGALRPTNTWDLYTYFPLAALALAYTLFLHFDVGKIKLPQIADGFAKQNPFIARGLISAFAVILLYEFSSLLYAPFTYWYSQAYGEINSWYGTHTPISSYLTHWGLFLFIITAWLVWETREWMAATPVSHLNKLKPYILWMEISLAGFFALLGYFAIEAARIGFLALPLAAWAAILLLRPDQPHPKRFVLLMIGTALTLTMAVELVVLVGDIGRMNTVFKLYLQAWMLLAVSAAAAFGWLLDFFPAWHPRWRTVYQTGLYVLLGGAFLFTLTASTDKISDRMTPDAPRTLDSMTFMNHSQHWDGNMMDLSEDYRAIRWMQDNVQGSPVIVEANCTEYRWCTRFTIYTGLPGVVGWNWHQRQQRGHISTDVQLRVDEIGTFYNTPDIEWTVSFLKKYQVRYIVVGQLEQNVYPPVGDIVSGLIKFQQFEGIYWQAVYQDGSTTIYEVLK